MTLDADRDRTVTGFVALQSDFENTWKVWAGSLVGAALSEAAFEKTRRRMLSAAQRRYSDPDTKIHTMAWRSTFPDHRYRFDPLGTEQSLRSITMDELRQYAVEHLVKSRLLLVIVGDVSRAQIEKLVGSTIGQLPHGQYQWSPMLNIENRDPTWRVEQLELPTNYILGYAIGLRQTEKDYFAFEVATHLLASRLFSIIREEKSLSYTSTAMFIEGDIPVVGVYASSAAPDQVFNLVLQEIETLQAIGASGRAWRNFKDQFILQQLAQDLTNDGQADALSRAQLYFGDYQMADEYVDRLRRVSLNSVREVVRDYMRKMQWAFLGDPSKMNGQW